MALYRCLNVKCENRFGNVAFQSESPMVKCPKCGETMWRDDLMDMSKKNKYDSENNYAEKKEKE